MEDKREFQSLDDVKPGDCLVAFSYTDIFNTKEMLEKVMRKKKARQEPGVVEEVLPVFGAMPPEVKADIIKKFNENPERSCIVATDAIGMGMNLNINRIIFTNVWKSIKTVKRCLTPSEVKQIAGRAGRYEKDGFVNTLNAPDWRYVEKCLKVKDEWSKAKICLLPTKEVLKEYADNLMLHTGRSHHLQDVMQ